MRALNYIWAQIEALFSSTLLDTRNWWSCNTSRHDLFVERAIWGFDVQRSRPIGSGAERLRDLMRVYTHLRLYRLRLAQRPSQTPYILAQSERIDIGLLNDEGCWAWGDDHWVNSNLALLIQEQYNKEFRGNLGGVELRLCTSKYWSDSGIMSKKT